MDDLERWLRSAMQGAERRPSPDLVPGIWRRRRAHLRRTRAGSAAAVVAIAIAVPSALYTTTGGSGPPTRPGASATASPPAAPGSELLKCGAYSDRGIAGGELGANWQAESVRAGPVWFVYAGNGAWHSSQRLPDGRLGDVAGPIVAVKNGVTAEITTASADWSRFRFLTSATSSGSYTLHDGVRGLTLVGCPSYPVPLDMPPGYAAGFTLYYLPLGYVTDLTGCLPMQVAEPPSWRVRWTAEVSIHGRCT